ncbi:MAG: transglycosylase SLT domain-containing protein [Candidatus Fermentibacter sp.]|nr:transglycosylase SLT domain-containing protein [Candidatus Fermentibacter sp.]
MRRFALLMSVLALSSCRAVEDGGQAEAALPPDPSAVETAARSAADEGLNGESALLYIQAAGLRAEGDTLRMSDARAAALLLDEPSIPCAQILLASPDSLDALLAVVAGGAGIAPAMLEKLADSLVPMPEYAALLLAESLVAAGRGEEALRALSYAGDSFPAQTAGDLTLARYGALLYAGRLDEATDLRQGVPASDSVLRSRLLGALGTFRHESGAAGWEDAFSQSIRLWPSGYIHAPAFALLRPRLLSDSAFSAGLADAFYAGGLWNELYDIAVHAQDPPGHLVYLAARTRDRLGSYDQACALLDGYLDDHPAGADAENALMYLGLDLARGGLPDSGLAVLDRWESRYPSSPRRGNIPWYRGSILAEYDRWAEALPHFEAMMADYPSNVAADDAHFFLCLALLETGRGSEAAAELASFSRESGESVYAQSARYLLGRLLVEEGDASGMDTLRAVSRLGSESLAARFAQVRLGASPPSPGISSEPLEAWMTRNGVVPAPSTASSRRGAVLLDAGLRRWAVAEFKAAEEEVGGGGRMALFYLEHDVWERMPNCGWRLSTVAPEPWPADLWRLRYPAAWPGPVLRTSADFGFDPLLVWSIMRQESMFQPGASSPAGARGLIQMIPSTSEYVASRQGWDDYSPDALFEPGVSLRYGICYLSGVASEVDGPVKLLASYNGGPHNAAGRWGASTLSDDLFFCRITFNETRRYVEKVLANYEIYRLLYPSLAGLAQPRFTAAPTLSPRAGAMD